MDRETCLIWEAYQTINEDSPPSGDPLDGYRIFDAIKPRPHLDFSSVEGAKEAMSGMLNTTSLIPSAEKPKLVDKLNDLTTKDEVWDFFMSIHTQYSKESPLFKLVRGGALFPTKNTVRVGVSWFVNDELKKLGFDTTKEHFQLPKIDQNDITTIADKVVTAFKNNADDTPEYVELAKLKVQKTLRALYAAQNRTYDPERYKSYDKYGVERGSPQDTSGT